MPVYQYDGQHYDLPEGLSNEQAIAKIKTHLGQQENDAAGEMAKKVGSYAAGALETMTTGAVDAFGNLAGKAAAVAHAGLTGRNISQASDDFDELYNDSAPHKFLEPQTEGGKHIGELIGQGIGAVKDASAETGHAINSYYGMDEDAPIGNAYGALLSATPELSMLPMGGKGVKAAANRPNIPNPFKKAEASKGINAKSIIENDGNRSFDDKAAASQDATLIDRLKQIDQQQSFDPAYQAPKPPAGQTAFNDMAVGLAQDKASPYVPDNTPQARMDIVRQQIEQQRQLEAQRQLEQRHQAMEQGVAKQTDLQNHSDVPVRDEMENIWAGKQGEATMGNTADALLHPAVRAQRDALAQRSTDPLYVTPDKQALNVRPDDMAMEALRRQKEAAQNSLDYGIREKRKEPLNLLSRDSVLTSNDGPQARPQDIIGTGLEDHLAKTAAVDHPLVKAAEARLSKAEELLIKAADRGATRNQLARLQKDIDNLSAARDRTVTNVSQAAKEGRRARPFDFKKQGGGVLVEPIKTREPTEAELRLKSLLKQDVEENRHTHMGNMFTAPKFEPERRPGMDFKKQGGAINPAVFKEGYEKLKQLADGTWLRAHSDGQVLHIDSIKDSRNIGRTTFSPEYRDRRVGATSPERDATSIMTHVSSEHRSKGYAGEMYKFAAELGNDVKPSDTQLAPGKVMWDKFERLGMTKETPEGTMIIPKGQRGAIDPDVFLRMFPHFEKSKMVDESGQLKKFYHGTSKDKHFDDINASTRGAFFSDDPRVASAYAKDNDSQGFNYEGGKYIPKNTASRVHEVYLNIQNPYLMSSGDHQVAQHRQNYAQWQREIVAQKKAEGYDGIDFGHGIIIAFDKDQIKSAIAPENKTAVPKGQKGALLISPDKEPSRKVLDNIPGIRGILKSKAPSLWNAEEATAAAKAAPDVKQNIVQNWANMWTKGGQYMADRLDHNPVFSFANERIQKAERLTRADVESYLHDSKEGLGVLTREMSDHEKINIWGLMDWADKNQREMTPEFLKQNGATDAQIAYAAAHRKAMDVAYDRFTKEMDSLGHKPVSKRVGYAAMMADGDWRSMVRDSKGDIVGMVGSDLKWRHNYLSKALTERGFTVDKPDYMGANKRITNNSEQKLGQMMEWFASNDPRVGQLLDTVAEINSELTKNFLNMDVHTKAKKGIFGMEGRKEASGLEWAGGPLTRDHALANAEEGLKAQMAFFEMATKWGHLIDQLKDVREVMSDKDVAKSQPNAKLLTQDYINKALGYNPTVVGQHIEGAFSAIAGASGVGVSNIRKTTAAARQAVNGLLLGANPMFWWTNLVQPLQAMPGIKAYLTSRGLDTKFDLGTGYSYVGKGAKTFYDTITRADELKGIDKEAFDYARANHVYGSDLIEHSNHVDKGVGYAFEKATGYVPSKVELSTRASMFYGIVHMLHENGMKAEHGLFETAHNFTDMAMNNYSRTERPMAYDAIGPVGEIASNLSSYKHNELSRIAMYARDMSDGHYRPMVAQLLSGLFWTGVKGTIGYNVVDELLKYISAAAGHPTSLTREVMRMSQALGKQVNKFTGAKEGGLGDAQYVASHGVFSMLGLDMSNRLGLGDAVTPNIFPGGSKLADIATKGFQFAKNRDQASAKDLAYTASPIGPAQGVQDLTWFSKGDIGLRHEDWTGQVKRSTLDKVAKGMGGTGMHESAEKTKNYENHWIDQAYSDKRLKVLDKAKGELAVNGRVSDETFQAYLKARGDVASWTKFIHREAMNQATTVKDRDMKKSLGNKTPAARGHLNDILESDR